MNFSRQIFEITTQTIEFRENPSHGSRDVPCGWTDRHVNIYTDGHDATNCLFLQFWESTQKRLQEKNT